METHPEVVQVINVGGSLGIMLPTGILQRLGLSEGDELAIFETPEGIQLRPHDEFALQMEMAEQIMRENAEVLRRLAES